MREAPSLFEICQRTVARGLIDGNDHSEDILELPSDLLDCLVISLPPLALQELHELRGCDAQSIGSGKKRERCETFNTRWKVFFKERWPDDTKKIEPVDKVLELEHAEIDTSVAQSDDWQQLYWEAHLQNCLDEAVERALLPAFDGNIGEITISDGILKSIGCSNPIANSYSKLWHHCHKFDHFARCLRLHNVLCDRELCELLMNAKLRALVFCRIISKSGVDGACAFLKQNRNSLKSLEFIHCRLSSTIFSQICSLILEGAENHVIRHFSIKSSRISESKQSSLPPGLLLLLSSARSLESLRLNDVHMGPKSAKMILDNLLLSSSHLITLDISDNNLTGWLSKVDRQSTEISSTLGLNSPLKSLRILNLRGNNLGKDDAEDLNYLLVQMPNLRSLDISDNPLEDDGIRNLIPYFRNAFEKTHPLSDIKMENCDLSATGVGELLRSLPTLKEPLNSLSIADNDLGSSVTATLAKFLGSSRVKMLNIEDIDLGPFGFQELEKEMPKEMALVYINISKNRGGIDSASLVSKIISQAPDLIAVNAGYNLMPPKSSLIIYDALKKSRGKLVRLDLTGNTQLCQSFHTSKLLEFRFHGKPIVVMPSPLASSTPYDDDP